MNTIPIIVGLTAIAAAVGAGLLLCCRPAKPVLFVEPVFAGDSRELKATRVAPTLEAPIRKGTNTIWCASFLAAWKSLETDIANEPVTLQGAPGVALSLDRAPDPRPSIPEESLYVAAGWNDNGITDQIRKGLARKFPAKAQPTFPGILPDSFVAYAYLEASVNFATPYFQSKSPLVFTDRAGKKTELNSFGIRSEDDYAYWELREQPQVLFVATDDDFKLTQCAVDLDRTSQPNQIVLAIVEPKSTLSEVLADIAEKIDAADRKAKSDLHPTHDDGLGPNDVLLVPDVVWRITHRFTELEGRKFANAKLNGRRIDVAQQDIQFSLNRGGAELKSEAKLFVAPVPTYYVFDRPFILYMKKRGAKTPYFVMWIENAELLNKWKPDKKP